MKYAKPTIDLAATAVNTIQTSSKSQPPMLDQRELLRTALAYEADE